MIKINRRGSNFMLKKFNLLEDRLAEVYTQHTWLRIAINPLALAGLVVIILSVLGISGSSIGIYTAYFNEPADSGIVTGTPKAIRSDEWLVNSQMLIAQAEAGYPYINENIGNGQNMSLVLDVPYFEWSILLKPQNWIFFIAPFSFAFAFKWWFVLFLLFAASYLFALELLPRKKILSSLLSLIFCLSPFVQWWLAPGTTLILASSLFIIVLLLKIHRIPKANKIHKVIYSALLAYVLVYFAITLYPPFQIPCVLVIGVFYLSILYKYRREDNMWTSLIYIVCAGILAGVVIALYLFTRLDDVQTLLNTAYPGKRVVESGGLSIVHIFSNFLGPMMQSSSLTSLYTDNQSESSNFTLPFVTIIVISAVIAFKSYKDKDYRWNVTNILLLALFFVFLARMTLPFADNIYRFLFLGSVPNLRLIIGLGAIAFILLILNISYLQKAGHNLSSNERWGITLVCCTVYSSLLFSILGKAPGFIPNTLVAVLLLAIFTLFTWLLVNRKIVGALSLLLAFSAVSVIYIHPIYKGTEILTSNPLSTFIQETKKSGTTWIVSDTLQFENFAVMNGAHSLSGVYVLPQTELFSQLPASNGQATTNRYAHVIYSVSDKNSVENIELLQADLIKVNVSPCGNFIEKNKITHIIAVAAIESLCVKEVFKFDTHEPNPSSIYVYEIK